MPTSSWRKDEEVDSSSLSLDAATHFSEHFSGDIQPILHEWANGKSPTLQGAMVALPLIAQETCSHINATGDKRAEEAWHQFCSQLNQNSGFILTKARTRSKS